MERYPLNKPIAFVMAVFHVGAVAALFFFTWHRLELALFVWVMMGSFGIGVGYHRLLTHKGFKVPKWLEYTHATVAATALQGRAVTWVAIHLDHHAHTEKEHDPENPTVHDPHTPREGKLWSHLNWMLFPDPRLQDEVYLEKWVPHLLSQSFYRQKYMLWLPTTVLGIVILILRGWPAVLWGVLLPVTITLEFTWLVNSATHLWGSQPYDRGKNDSKNNWWVALLTFGEGWHNNHHANPTSARHGIKWYQLDTNWLYIRTLEALGLAKEVRRFTRR